MSALTDAIAKTSGEQNRALRWFLDHTGETVSWTVIKDQTDEGFRLVNQAKGIYKPHYTDYTLSVRQTISSSYADKDVIRRPDGGWAYPYFQEDPNPDNRDKWATNRGLMKCKDDGVPVGVLLQTKPKPGVEYLVVGLAAVADWKDGYFILEGFSEAGGLPPGQAGSNAAYDQALALATSPTVEDFDLQRIEDRRERQIAQVVRRRGQAKFRLALMQAYEGRCAISGCDAAEALEAAHISPYRGDLTNHPQNGLLLRADLHSLFDLGLLSIDPRSMAVKMSPRLAATNYAELLGKTIAQPIDVSFHPHAEALAQHMKWSGLWSEP